MGASMAVGDIDGDDIEDLVLASPFASIGDKKWNGAVSVVLGGQTDHSANINIYGDHSGDQLGTALSVADFDGDGSDDIAISASTDGVSTSAGEKRTGKIFIISGKRLLNSQADSRLNSHNISQLAYTVLTGKTPGDLYGIKIESQDVNLDGRYDLIASAPLATIRGIANIGSVYIYINTKEGIDPYHDFAFSGQNVSERFGTSFKIGDFDGDGRYDMAVGAPQAYSEEIVQAGMVYIYHDFIDKHSGAIEKPNLTIKGESEKQWFGFNLDIGNINDDGYDDLVVASFPFNGTLSSAKLKAYYGETLSEDLPKTILAEDLPLSSMPGSQVELRDLNDDGRVDIIVGMPVIGEDGDEKAGDVYIGYGEGFEMGSALHGENADDWFGYSFAILDFNNDGFEDLAVSSRYSDSDAGVNNGKVYIFPGNGSPFGKLTTVVDNKETQVSRAEFVRVILSSFDLKEKKKDYIDSCLQYKEFCLFNFMAMSSFDGIALEPELVLYPDVGLEDEYYEEINTATMLGLITGYLDEKDSPFNPDRPVSRIQALKIILGAADLVQPKYQFELIDMLGSYENLLSQSSYFKDVDSMVKHMWWYPRYTNYAIEHGIIDMEDNFRPDENISTEELNDMILRTIDSIN